MRSSTILVLELMTSGPKMKVRSGFGLSDLIPKFVNLFPNGLRPPLCNPARICTLSSSYFGVPDVPVIMKADTLLPPFGAFLTKHSQSLRGRLCLLASHRYRCRLWRRRAYGDDGYGEVEQDVEAATTC